MPDREKVINGVEHCFHGQECCGDTECPYYIEHLSDCCCLGECQENLKADVIALLKERKAVEPQDAEMLIIHNGGAEEYVKDIESIVLLAHKDYDIVYCGTFGRSVKW